MLSPNCNGKQRSIPQCKQLRRHPQPQTRLGHPINRHTLDQMDMWSANNRWLHKSPSVSGWSYGYCYGIWSWF